jgi:hypothetical protein
MEAVLAFHAPIIEVFVSYCDVILPRTLTYLGKSELIVYAKELHPPKASKKITINVFPVSQSKVFPRQDKKIPRTWFI